MSFKLENEKMSEKITLSVLTKFVKSYNGDRETLPAFLTNCENAMSLATQDQQNVLCKYIISQMEGKAQVACSLKSFEKWSELKTFLKSTFGEKKHATHLLSDLQHCKQLPNEDITQYSLRIESILTRIQSDTHHSCKDEKELPGRIAAMEDLALNTFMLGLNSSISNIVRCKNPTTLNEAIQYAIDEEKLYNLLKPNSKSVKQCSTCNKVGHNSSECFRNKKPNYNSQKPYHKVFISQSNSYKDTNSNAISNANSNSNSNTNSNVQTCKYCKNFGHTIEQCRKRQFNMQRRENTDSAQRYHNSPNSSTNAFTHTCECEANDHNNHTESHDNLN